MKYYDSVKPSTSYLALNRNANFVPELGMGHGAGEKRRGDAENRRDGDILDFGLRDEGILDLRLKIVDFNVF